MGFCHLTFHSTFLAGAPHPYNEILVKGWNAISMGYFD